MYLCIVVKYLSASKRHQTLLTNRWLHKCWRGEAQSSYERAQSVGRGPRRLGDVPLASQPPGMLGVRGAAASQGNPSFYNGPCRHRRLRLDRHMFKLICVYEFSTKHSVFDIVLLYLVGLVPMCVALMSKWLRQCRRPAFETSVIVQMVSGEVGLDTV